VKDSNHQKKKDPLKELKEVLVKEKEKQIY
jgi:hypothetical protein